MAIPSGGIQPQRLSAASVGPVQTDSSTPRPVSPAPAGAGTDSAPTVSEQVQVQNRPTAAFSPQASSITARFDAQASPTTPGFQTRGAITSQVHTMLRSPEGRQQLVAAEAALARLSGNLHPESLSQTPALAWISSSLRPGLNPAELRAVTSELKALLTPVVNILNNQNRDPAVTHQNLMALNTDNDPMRLLPLLESEGLVPAAAAAEARDLRQTLITDRSGSGAMDFLMSLEVNGHRDISRYDYRGVGERTGPMDSIRSRLLVSSQRAPAELAQLAPLLESLRQNPGAQLSEANTELLESFGIRASNGTLTAVSNRPGQADQTLGPADIGMLSTDLRMLTNPTSPAAATYIGALQRASQATNNYENAVAEFAQLNQQRSEIIQRRETHIADKDQLTQVIGRISLVDSPISPQDTALLHRIDPRLQFENPAGGQTRILLEGQEISRDQLLGHLQGTSQDLEDKIVEDTTELAVVEDKIVVQRGVVAEAEANLVAARQEAEVAFQAMSPEDQARYAEMHQAFMRDSERALARGRETMRGFDAELEHLPGYAQAAASGGSASGATSSQAGSGAPPTEPDTSAPLAAQPGSSTTLDQSERDSQEAGLRELSRASSEHADQNKRTDANFVNRILALKHELAEEEREYQNQRRDRNERLTSEILALSPE